MAKKINNMEKSEKHKKTAIETLEAVVHWMKTSVFDYDEKDLELLLYDAFLDYKKYLNK